MYSGLVIYCFALLQCKYVCLVDKNSHFLDITMTDLLHVHALPFSLFTLYEFLTFSLLHVTENGLYPRGVPEGGGD